MRTTNLVQPDIVTAQLQAASAMESSSKRRKIEHAGSGLRHDAIIDFEARSSAQVSTASTFILQTDELLKEAKLNYGKAFSDANGHLFKIKEIVEAIEPHDALPVSCRPAKEASVIF